jgi:hypothetical protein
MTLLDLRIEQYLNGEQTYKKKSFRFCVKRYSIYEAISNPGKILDLLGLVSIETGRIL